MKTIISVLVLSLLLSCNDSKQVKGDTQQAWELYSDSCTQINIARQQNNDTISMYQDKASQCSSRAWDQVQLCKKTGDISYCHKGDKLLDESRENLAKSDEFQLKADSLRRKYDYYSSKAIAAPVK